MELENKIKCVLMDFEINEITLQEATKRILLLLDVVGRSEQLSCETCIFNTHFWSEDYPCTTCCGFDKHQATVSVRSEQLKCEHKGRRKATELVEYCEDCKKILFHP